MGEIAFANLTQTSTEQLFGLGDTYETREATYTYVQANGAIDQYDLVTLDADFQAVAGTTTTSGIRPTGGGVAQLAFANDEYGWVPTGPFKESAGFKVNALANCSANVPLYTSSTAGHVDDTVQDIAEGLVLTAAVGGSPAAATCQAVRGITFNT